MPPTFQSPRSYPRRLEHVQESTFINDLQLEIRAEVRMMKPSGLREVMKFA